MWCRRLALLLIGITPLATAAGAADAASVTVDDGHLIYPIDARAHCPAGWTKMTARRRVHGAVERYVGCAIASTATSHLRAPEPPLPPLATTAVLPSINWSGYEARGAAPYLAVSAEWQVPRVVCSSRAPFAATADWIGVGGDDSVQLFQSGTESVCSPAPAAYAWWTTDTHGFRPLVQMRVHPRDVIYSKDWQLGPGRWQYVVADLTTGQRITSRRGVAWTGPADTIEWIAENPGDNPGPRDLVNFGTETFHDLGVTSSGATVSTMQPIDILAPNGSAVASTTGLVLSGASTLFSVIYEPPK